MLKNTLVLAASLIFLGSAASAQVRRVAPVNAVPAPAVAAPIALPAASLVPSLAPILPPPALSAAPAAAAPAAALVAAPAAAAAPMTPMTSAVRVLAGFARPAAARDDAPALNNLFDGSALSAAAETPETPSSLSESWRAGRDLAGSYEIVDKAIRAPQALVMTFHANGTLEMREIGSPAPNATTGAWRLEKDALGRPGMIATRSHGGAVTYIMELELRSVEETTDPRQIRVLGAFTALHEDRVISRGEETLVLRRLAASEIAALPKTASPLFAAAAVPALAAQAGVAAAMSAHAHAVIAGSAAATALLGLVMGAKLRRFTARDVVGTVFYLLGSVPYALGAAAGGALGHYAGLPFGTTAWPAAAGAVLGAGYVLHRRSADFKQALKESLSSFLELLGYWRLPLALAAAGAVVGALAGAGLAGVPAASLPSLPWIAKIFSLLRMARTAIAAHSVSLLSQL